MLRELRADNPSPMTLDGTRTWLVGRRQLAIIDPGPALDAHVAALAAAAAAADTVVILLTHGHPDHAEAAPALAERTGARVRAIADASLADGDVTTTDAGELVTLHTPGHTPDHASFHWPAERAIFCGDLMMGGLDTALVAPPEGDLFDYLASLERLRALRPAVIHPAHGPDFTDPAAAIDRYVRHREERCEQVTRALSSGPLTADQVAAAVYGDTVPPALRDVALAAVHAYLGYLHRRGRIDRRGDRWAARDPAGAS